MRSIFYFFLIAFSFAGFGQNNKPLNVVFVAVDDLKPSIRSFGDAYASQNQHQVSTNREWGIIFLKSYVASKL